MRLGHGAAPFRQSRTARILSLHDQAIGLRVDAQYQRICRNRKETDDRVRDLVEARGALFDIRGGEPNRLANLVIEDPFASIGE